MGCSVYAARRLYGVLGFGPPRTGARILERSSLLLSLPPVFVVHDASSSSIVSLPERLQCCDVFHWYSCCLKGGLLHISYDVAFSLPGGTKGWRYQG